MSLLPVALIIALAVVIVLAPESSSTAIILGAIAHPVYATAALGPFAPCLSTAD